MRPALLIEVFDPSHDRSRFDCGDEAINAYLHVGLDRDVGYENVPATLLGRMGVDRAMAGQGFGTDLVVDAMRRALAAARSTTGSSLFVIDAKSDALIAFYARLGFASLPDEPRRLVYPMRKIEQLFADAG